MPELVNPEPDEKTATVRPGSLTVREARSLGRRLLATQSETGALDTDQLLTYATGMSAADQFAHPDRRLTGAQASRFHSDLKRRLEREPVAYITGVQAFRTIELSVDGRVLVPRPETELLVEIGLTVLRTGPDHASIVDVGTGSGAVALALASELPDVAQPGRIVASDVSPDALDVARSNAQRLGLAGRVQFVESDLLCGVDGTFDLMLANLPYLRTSQRHPSTIAEPDLALYAGSDGLDLYRQLLPQAGVRLRPGGLVACEIDPDQGRQMEALAGRCIGGDAALLRDLAGRDRFLVAGAVDMVRTVVETWRYGA